MILYSFLTIGDSPRLIFSSLVLVAYSLIPCVSTILVGRVFSAFTDFASGRTSSPDFLDKVASYTSGLFILAALSLGLGALAHSSWLFLGFLQGHRARTALFRSMVDRDSEWHDSQSSVSGIVNIAYKDVADLESATGVETFEAIKALVTVLASLCIALYYSWAVTLICLAGFPLMALSTSLIGPRISDRLARSKKVMDAISDKLNFVLGALTTVRIFGHEDSECTNVIQLSITQQKIEEGRWHFFQLMEGCAHFIILAMFVQGFFFGSYMVKHHGLDSGNVMTVFWSCLTSAGAAQELLTSIVELQKGVVAAVRLSALIDVDEEQKMKDSIGMSPKLFGPPAIIFDNVVFSYPSRPELIFTNLDLELAAGKTHFIVGPSGSGKSSIGLLLVRQYIQQAGFVKIAGYPLEHLSRQWVQQNVALVQQDTKLFGISIADNVRIGSRTPHLVTDRMVRIALQEMCADFVFQLPDEIHTLGNIRLSGGQVQRIMLARAWISDAPVMIFDECTSALDAKLSQKVMAAIRRFRKNKTTILITHDMSLVGADDSLSYIEDGHASYYRSTREMNQSHDNRATIYEEFHGSKIEKDDSEPYSLDNEMQDIQIQTNLDDKNCTKAGLTSSILDIVKYGESLTVMKGLWKSQISKIALVCSLGLVAVHAVINPIFAFMFSKLLMGLVPSSGVNVVLWSMLVLLCAFLDGVTAYLKVSTHIVALRWQTAMREELLLRLLGLVHLKDDEVSYYRKLIVSDIDKILEVITTYWTGIVQIATISLVGLIWAISQGWKLSLVGISLVPLIGIFSVFFKRLTEFWNGKREDQRLNVIQLMDEIVTNFRVVKSNSLESHFEDIYTRRESHLWDVSKRAILRLSLGYGFVQIFSPLIQGLLLYYGMKLTSTGEYSPSKTMLVFAMLVFTLVTLDGVLSSIPNIGSGFEAASRLLTALRDLKRPIVPGKYMEWDLEQPLDSSITVTNAALTHGSLTVFSSLDLEVKRAGILAIVGRSGCGKTSLARSLMGLQQLSHGNIFFGDEEIHAISIARLRNNVSMVEQMPLKLFEGSIYDNIAYGLNYPMEDLDNINQREVIEAAMDTGIHEFISSLEEGYSTIIKSGLLSGGQMQRLGIARSLVRKPKILILDEPTSALDAASKETFKSLILRLREARGCTIIIISHQADLAEIADKVVDLS